jgi:hypothetical protein
MRGSHLRRLRRSQRVKHASTHLTSYIIHGLELDPLQGTSHRKYKESLRFNSADLAQYRQYDREQLLGNKSVSTLVRLLEVKEQSSKPMLSRWEKKRKGERTLEEGGLSLSL